MKKKNILWAGLIGSFTVSAAFASTSEPAWLSPSLGPISPSAHLRAAVGSSTGDPEELASGHHDPSRKDGTLQGLELGLSLRQQSLEGFVTYNISYGAEEEWETGAEEAFLKLKDLPGGFEIRGGRLLNRFGQHNAHHLHAWKFVDTPLVYGRFLGEDGLITDGGDLTWLQRGISTTFGATIGFGAAKTHDHEHDHGHEEEGEHEGEHEEEHGDEHGDDDHDHDEEHEEHSEEVVFNDQIFSSRVFGQYQPNDFNGYEGGLSLAMGDDEEERRISVVGLDAVYTWREKGFEPDGRSLTWTTEFLYRDVEEVSGEFGAYSSLVYALDPALDVGARIEYVEGNEELETEERYRLSPMVTAYLDPYRRTSLRVQYNYDDIVAADTEHSVWFQLGLSWGAAEVR